MALCVQVMASARRIEKSEPVLEAVVFGRVTLEVNSEHRRRMSDVINFYGSEMKLTFVVVDGAWQESR
jgi:DTW domain-containing protein YfiP